MFMCAVLLPPVPLLLPPLALYSPAGPEEHGQPASTHCSQEPEIQPAPGLRCNYLLPREMLFV